jgi:nucleoside-diphosphate-sugar epimerase
MTSSETFWSGKKVLITGGASFIGSTLADQLIAKGATIRAVDDLTSGHLSNIQNHIAAGKLEFIHADLREPGVARSAVAGIDTVFHLAADHGGRGYVDLHQAGPASNFFLDGLIFSEALRAKVRKVVFASSGCVYPNFLQADTNKILYLTEDLTKGPNDADNTYGWAKLMGEFTLQAYAKEHGLKAASCRYFTVYGPRGVENHAVIAMILAGEKIDDGTPVNLGTMERVRVIDAVNMVLEFTGQKAEIKFLRDMPTGPLNRVADNSRAKQLLGWEPQVSFREGLRRTIDWYYKTKDRAQVQVILKRMLTER